MAHAAKQSRCHSTTFTPWYEVFIRYLIDSTTKVILAWTSVFDRSFRSWLLEIICHLLMVPINPSVFIHLLHSSFLFLRFNYANQSVFKSPILAGCGGTPRIPALWEWRKEDQVFTVNFSSKMTWRLTYFTLGPLFKEQLQKANCGLYAFNLSA